MKTNTSIELYAGENKKGVTLPIHFYELVRSSIIKSLLSDPEKSLPLSELIDQVTSDVSAAKFQILPWHILQVKIDLQERGDIKVHFNREKRQIVEIGRKNPRKYFKSILHK